MMTPIKNALTNLEVGKPRDWDDSKGECLSLPVHFDPNAGFYSWYALSWRDRLKILFGHPVRLFIATARHPVISIEVNKS